MVTINTKPKAREIISEDGPLDTKFEKLVTETLERWHVPGVAIAVVDGEKTYSRVGALQSILSTTLTSLLLGIWYRISS